MRVSKKTLDHYCQVLNKTLGRPLESWKRIDGRNIAQVGNFHVAKEFIGFSIHEMSNENGGVNTLPHGKSGMTSGECLLVLQSAVESAERLMPHFEVSKAVLEWAKTPGNHGGNPYMHKFVKLAEQAISRD